MVLYKCALIDYNTMVLVHSAHQYTGIHPVQKKSPLYFPYIFSIGVTVNTVFVFYRNLPQLSFNTTVDVSADVNYPAS